MVAGHRRKKAADLAGLAEIPCIVRQLTDDEATIIMVDSNLQREQILPSEKAFAYKMKLDAMKRQGQRTDLTSDRQWRQKLKGCIQQHMLGTTKWLRAEMQVSAIYPPYPPYPGNSGTGR